MRNSSNWLIASPHEKEETREKFAIAWDLYLTWRSGNSQQKGEVTRRKGPASVLQRTGISTFELLGAAEMAAREALRSHFLKSVPLEFVMALMESTADTAARFMLANSDDAPRYRSLAFDVLWSGLSAIATSDHKGR